MQFDHDRASRVRIGWSFDEQNRLMGFAQLTPDVPDFVQALVGQSRDIGIGRLVIETGRRGRDPDGTSVAAFCRRGMADAESAQLEVPGGMASRAMAGKT